MKLLPFDFLKSSNLFQSNRNRLRWMEWFIAIFFIVSLLIGSGVFIKVSNAASSKIKNNLDLHVSEVSTIPGSMRILAEVDNGVHGVISMDMDENNSCELKKET